MSLRVFEIVRGTVSGERYGTYREATAADVTTDMVERAAELLAGHTWRGVPGEHYKVARAMLEVALASGEEQKP